MRETEAHADFLFHFAKTVIVYCTFNSSSTTMLLSEYMANCLEAYAATITYVNGYDAWMEEATRREEGRNEDSDSPSSAGSRRKRRRFTEKSEEGSGKFKGWDKSGIRLYNKINKVLDKQERSDESLVEFDKKLKTWFLKGKNSSPISQNDDDEYDSEDEVATNNFICKRRAMEALGQQVGQQTPI